MAKVQIKVIKPDRIYDKGRLLLYGEVVEIPEEIAEVWVNAEVAEYLDSPVTQKVDTLSLDEFNELKAEQQKDYLEKLGVKGDASNEEKRTILYSDFLDSQKTSDE
jgi:hypothetical protein